MSVGRVGNGRLSNSIQSQIKGATTQQRSPYMLLFWSKNVGNGIAAVRFQNPVLVYSVRVVPSGVAPFTAVPSEVGETRPDDISLRIYFNAQALPAVDRPKGTQNALVPVEIEYHGQLCEFPIRMEQFSTRLMIFEGAFESLSVAVYGRLASDTSDTPPTPSPAPPLEYKPIELPIISHRRIHLSMDPAHNAQPSNLAAAFLAELYPHYTLDGIIRRLLVFDPNSNNEHHSNGTLVTATAYPDLASCIAADDSETDWLASAVLAAQSPFMAYVPADVDRFSARIQNCLGVDDEEPNTDQRYYFFELLRHFSCQPDYVILNFLRPGVLARFFRTRLIHSASLVRLHEAVANPYVAHSVRDDPAVVEALVAMQDNPALPRTTQELTQRVLERARGWASYEDILTCAEGTPYDTSNLTSSTLSELVTWLSDMTNDQSVFGPFLLSILPNFSPTSSPPTSGAISSLHELNSNASQVEIFRWVRAYQGVASVGATLAWALAEFDHPLIRRLLAILKLWLNCDYKEITAMVLTQESILYQIGIFNESNDVPPLLLDLLKDTLSTCDSHFRSVRIPRTAKELGDLNSTSYNLAVQYLDDFATDVSVYFEDPAVLLDLRAALTLVCRVSEMGLDSKLSLARGPSSRNLIGSVLRIAMHLVDVAVQAIPLSPSITYSPIDHDSLLEISILLLNTLHRVLTTYIHSRRTRQNITHLAIKLFLHSYHPLLNYPRYRNYVSRMREITPTLLLTIIESVEDPFSVTETLKDILDYPFMHPITSPDAPQYVVHLLDSIVTQSKAPDHGELWSRRLTGVLPELATLLGTIGSTERANVIKRLNTMDDETFGIGAWLLAALCRDMDEAVRSIPEDSRDETKRSLLLHFVDSGFKSLHLLTQAEGLSEQSWGSIDVAQPLAFAMMTLIELEAAIVSVVQFAVALSGLKIPPHRVLHIPVAVSLLRASRMTPSQLHIFDTLGRSRVLLERYEFPLEPYIVEKVCEELGFVLARVLTADEEIYQSQNVSSTSAEAIVFLARWAQMHSPRGSPRFVGLSDASFQRLIELLTPFISREHSQFLDAARSTIQFVDYPPLHLSYANFASRPRTTFNELKRACDPDSTPMPSTPILRPKTPTRDNLSVVATLMSPPILRSPTIQLNAPSTQKKYANNDFRQARVSPASASRPPSTHVDAFENAALSPGLATPSSPLSVTDLLGAGLNSPTVIYHAL